MDIGIVPSVTDCWRISNDFHSSFINIKMIIKSIPITSLYAQYISETDVKLEDIYLTNDMLLIQNDDWSWNSEWFQSQVEAILYTVCTCMYVCFFFVFFFDYVKFAMPFSLRLTSRHSWIYSTQPGTIVCTLGKGIPFHRQGWTMRQCCPASCTIVGLVML